MTVANPFVAPVNHDLLDQASYLARKIVPGVRRRLVNRIGSELLVREVGSTSSTIGEQLDAVLGAPAALATLKVGRHRMAAILQGRVLSRLLGLMLGADPDAGNDEGRAALTRIDLRVGGRLCDDIADTLAEQTGLPVDVIDMRPAPRSLAWAARSTKCVAMELAFGPDDAPFGQGALVVPMVLAGALFGSTGAPDTRSAEVDRVLPLEVEVIAELARIPMVVADLSNLEVGSLIDLGGGNEIVLSVNGKPTLIAEAGEADGVRSIRVIRQLSLGS
jgi:flagellar motor switch protein FliM